MDGVGGFSDGPEGRWQRYPDQRYADQGFPDRGYAESGAGGLDAEPERDGRPFGDRPYDARYEPRGYGDREPGRDRHSEPDESYRVLEPRFGDVAGPRYQETADPRFGGPEQGGQRYEPRDRDQAGYEPPSFAPAAQQPGPPAPPAQPGVDEREHHLTEQIDRSALRRPPAGPGGPAPSGPPPTLAPTVYRSRRPALIILLVIVSIVVEMLLLFVVGHGLLGDKFSAGELLAGIFAMSGTPLTAIGFYAVVTGAPAATGAHPAQSWFRAPTAYLPVGLVLLVAAAIAVR